MEFGKTQGEAGDIEWMFESTSTSHCMILCHPHPLYGGSMHDGVLECIARVAKTKEIATVRFNFRGVGASQGQHDKGIGEISDLAHVIEAFEGKFDRISLGGYSFGARVALNYVVETNSTLDLVLVAPPTEPALPEVDSKVDVIVGETDFISQLRTLDNWVSQTNRALHTIEDADHFLAAYESELEAAVIEAMNR